MAATSAFAQSNVTIAGIIDQAWQSSTYQSRDGLKSTKQTGLGEGAWAGSRIRFSGVEDMGGGMKAKFWLEQGLAPSSGNAFNYRNNGNAAQIESSTSFTTPNRQSWVALEGGFGELRAGRIYTPTYDMYTNTGHINGEYNGNGQAAFAAANRSKGVGYTSPEINGFQAYIVHGGKDDFFSTVSTEDQQNGKKVTNAKYDAWRVMWKQGAARAGAAFETFKENCTANAAAGAANFFGVATAAASCANTGVVKTTSSAYQGGYNFGMADLGFITGTKKADSTFASATASSEVKLNQLMLKVPVSSVSQVLLTTYTLKTTNTATGALTADYSGKFVNYNYDLSKRTKTYISYGTDKDDVSGITQGVTNEQKKTAIGVVHFF